MARRGAGEGSVYKRTGGLWVLLVAIAIPTLSHATDSLDKMQVVFVGGFSREAIKARLDPVMIQYKLLPLTDENYSRAGSALVGLRQESGIPEMEILACMAGARPPGVNLEFSAGVGLCAFLLQAVREGDSK